MPQPWQARAGPDPARVGPFRLAPFAFGLGVLILPTLVALGAAFYALASWTRSTLATYVGLTETTRKDHQLSGRGALSSIPVLTERAFQARSSSAGSSTRVNVTG